VLIDQELENVQDILEGKIVHFQLKCPCYKFLGDSHKNKSKITLSKGKVVKIYKLLYIYCMFICLLLAKKL
jgi:hypothetical protein